MTTTRPLVRWASINADGEVDIWETKADARPRMKSLDAVTEIVRLVEAPRWIPVSERTPGAAGAWVIGTNGLDVMVVRWAGFDWRDSDARKVRVTHWQPLPEPPKP